MNYLKINVLKMYLDESKVLQYFGSTCKFAVHISQNQSSLSRSRYLMWLVV